ncbi:MAG: cell division protein FtsA [Elusimicrobia bacterium CG1_02_37_114]|nr:MAG: cell division protein FtsA [Elusimicrobia bacterium CG1_02_37_114]PIV52251.1 MAG: cell division protein FtsA [Elusimicrobia bacterium CG02_land_8_20_14_3_00_37_13]PIZ13707.1 MAG: cell division protein FtsA [Elusimicrobia bacterium CG_4_10_14_0_8_um_filter_37_32]
MAIKEEIVCGLDIGSSQIVCVLGKYDTNRNTIEIIASGRNSCKGVKGGVVVSIHETAYSIKSAIEEAEEQTDEVVNKVYLGIRGEHIETLNNRGVVSISRTDKEITADDVEQAIDNAKAIQISPDRDIIDTIPQEFSLDRQKGVPNPIGMDGHYLEVYVHIVTAGMNHLTNIYKSVSQAGFSVVEPIYGIMALGDIVVLDEEKDVGCLLIDFGGQTTGMAIYSEGSIRFSREISCGSDLITRDIAHALHTSLAQAQLVKEKYGVTIPNLVKEDKEIEFIGVDGHNVHKTTRKRLADIIAPRLEEISERINDEIQNSTYADAIVPGGIILTGGGAKLQNCAEAFERVIGISTRMGLPQNIMGSNEIISNPVYATAIGVLRYRPHPETSRIKRIMKRIPLWKRVRDLF